MSEEPPALVSLLLAICFCATMFTIVALFRNEPAKLNVPETTQIAT